MDYRYSEDTINLLVRKALKLEKRRLYNEALEIYFDLHNHKVDFATERIKVVFDKVERAKLSKVNNFMGIIGFTASSIVIVMTAYYIGETIITTPQIGATYEYELYNKYDDLPKTIDNIKPAYRYENELPKSEHGYEIYVNRNIKHTKLNDRVQEAVESYISTLPYKSKLLQIEIKTFGKKSTHIGTIEVNPDNPQECQVILKKK